MAQPLDLAALFSSTWPQLAAGRSRQALLAHLTACLQEWPDGPSPPPERVTEWDGALRTAQRQVQASNAGGAAEKTALAAARAALANRWPAWAPESPWGWHALAEAVRAVDLAEAQALIEAPGAPDGPALSHTRIGVASGKFGPARSLLGWWVDAKPWAHGLGAANLDQRLAGVRLTLAHGVDPNGPAGPRGETAVALATESAVLKTLLHAGGRLQAPSSEGSAVLCDWLAPDLPLPRVKQQLAAWADSLSRDRDAAASPLAQELRQAWPTLVARFATRLAFSTDPVWARQWEANAQRGGGASLEKLRTDLVRQLRALGLLWDQDMLRPEPGEPSLWGEWDKAILVRPQGLESAGDPWKPRTPAAFEGSLKHVPPKWGTPMAGAVEGGGAAAVWTFLKALEAEGGDRLPNAYPAHPPMGRWPDQLPDFWPQALDAIGQVPHRPTRWRLLAAVAEAVAATEHAPEWRRAAFGELQATVDVQRAWDGGPLGRSLPPEQACWVGATTAWMPWLKLCKHIETDWARAPTDWPAETLVRLVGAHVLSGGERKERLHALWERAAPLCGPSDRRWLLETSLSPFARERQQRWGAATRAANEAFLHRLRLECRLPDAPAGGQRPRM